MEKLGAQKQSIPPRNKVWVRKEFVPMTKDACKKNENMVVHTVRMVGHQELNQSEEQETLNQMLTRAATRRKGAARQNDPRSSNLQRLPADSSLLDDPHDEDEEEEPVFMANDPKDAMIASLKRQVDEKDRVIINLYKKIDGVMGLLLNVQSNLENQQNQTALQSDKVRPNVSQSMNTLQPTQTTPSVALQPAPAEPQNHQDNFLMTKKQIQELISSQVKQTIDETATKRKSRGHPYPIEYDRIPFPDGYIVPKFKTFYGIGNPNQHLAHFKATCGNTGGNSALLLRQFPQSLSGVAFEWYYSLEDEFITTWDNMEEAFRTKFATVSDKITIADLVAIKRMKDESMLEYITRWRNLSIRCEQPIEQTQAVGLLMGNIDNWMAPFLCTT
uniref:Retrotransposon gag domain-containing protein n=1 Tax=Ananas comosus var. bracteatus TaxID=296719 RepID=A0A6V7Q5M2_ANACO|nr:unnamed protein product [Ananas comosus var. bracteatus]